MSYPQNALGDRVCRPHHLCDTCESIFESSELVKTGPEHIAEQAPEDYPYHQSFRELERAAEARCHFCALFLSAIKVSSLRYCPSCSFTVHMIPDGRLFSIKVRSEARSLCKHNPYSELRTEEGSGEASDDEEDPRGGVRDPSLGCITSYPQEHVTEHPASQCLTTSSAAHMHLANYWLTKCYYEHEACRKLRTSVMPKRLIDVGTGEEDSVHLMKPDADQVLHYVTLSHCWGDGRSIRALLSSNEEEYMKSIVIESLASTFRDAITVTRKLGLRHLWIDCLCIMQDSQDEKSSEISRMGSIYQNSYCTIAASGSANPDGGCFQDRNPLLFTALVPTSHVFANGTYWSIIAQDHVMVLTEDEPSTTSERAWCYQEYVLSPRLLIFGQNRMTWECITGRASELKYQGEGYYLSQTLDRSFSLDAQLLMRWTNGQFLFPYATQHDPSTTIEITMPFIFDDEASLALEISCGENFDLCGSGGRAELLTLLRLSTNSASDQYHHFAHQTWFSLVSSYSNRKLTFEGDKVLALAGFVERVQTTTTLLYVAGLWKQTLPLDLLWFVKLPAYSRPVAYRGPSWSWVAVDAPTSAWLAAGYNIASLKAKLQYISYEVSHEQDADEYSPILNAGLRIRGYIKQPTNISDFTSNGETAEHILSLPCSPDAFIVKFIWYERDLLPKLYDGDQTLGILRPDTTAFNASNIWLMPIFQAERLPTFPRDMPRWAKWWSHESDIHVGMAPMMNLFMLRDPKQTLLHGNCKPFTLCGLALTKTEAGYFTRIGIFHFDFIVENDFAARWFDDCATEEFEIR